MPTSGPPVDVKVAYYIAPETAALEITTPGGGGDNVRYYPYRDIEVGLRRVLATVFRTVVKLATAPTPGALSSEGVAYVIVPAIVTTSGGSGFFTWPPTSFTVDLTSQVRAADGSTVVSPRVVGLGSAETGERMLDHGLAGRRAMEDALRKMQAALAEVAPRLAQTTQKPSAPRAEGSLTDRLIRLKELRERNLITEEEYLARRKALLDSL